MNVTKSGRRSRTARTPSPDEGRRAGFARNLSGALTAAWSSVATLVGRMPDTLDVTRTRARGVASALQTLPDPTLQWLAATSVGLSAGLFLAGKPRLVIAAGIAPALAMGVAIVARPVEPVVPETLVPASAGGPHGETRRRAGWDLTRSGRGGVKRG